MYHFSNQSFESHSFNGKVYWGTLAKHNWMKGFKSCFRHILGSGARGVVISDSVPSELSNTYRKMNCRPFSWFSRQNLKQQLRETNPPPNSPSYFISWKLSSNLPLKSSVFLSWHVHPKIYVKFAVPNVTLMATPVQIVTRQNLCFQEIEMFLLCDINML